jgi:hypothetical protein
MLSKRVLMWTTVDIDVKKLVIRIVSSKGICQSEYLRQLVLEDLDKRSLITSKVKHELSLLQDSASSENAVKPEKKKNREEAVL